MCCAGSKRPLTEAVLVGVSQAAMVSGYVSAFLAERRAQLAERVSA